jgi:N-hydroxyarylamine O-acetyltransferase
MSDIDLGAYCARIGYDGPRAATLEVLRDLHRLHPAAIPFEGMDPLLGRPVDLAPAALETKLIYAGRGGYCFEHNSLFKLALEGFGFEVDALIARTRWSQPTGVLNPRTHMALRVPLGGKDWLVDVGYGGSMQTAPLDFAVREPQATCYEPSRLRPEGDELRLETLIDGEWKAICDLMLTAQADADFVTPNWYTSTHPDSRFKRNLIAVVTRADERISLGNNRLTIRRRGQEAERRVLDADGIEAALRDMIRLPVEDDWRPAIEWAATVETDGV